MEKLLNKLLEMMGVGRIVVSYWDGETAHVSLPLGIIDGGTYGNGLWGEVELLDTDATLNFTCGDLYGEGEFYIGEGTVNLNYAPHNEGLAYTNELEDLITARIKELYNLDAAGSEQGMQGDGYLSLDIYTELEATPAA
jgi:hypothetical protein